MTEPHDRKKRARGELEPALAAEPELWEALASAYRPSALDSQVNENLILAAVEDPLCEPSAEERAESERFREALEGRGKHPHLALVEALTQSHHGTIDQKSDLVQANEQAITKALTAPESVPAPSAKPSKGNVVYVTFGVMTAVALAAASFLLVTFPVSTDQQGIADFAATQAPTQRPPLTQSRSTTALFKSRFERSATTERVDTIASVRSRELRANRYAQWGVK